MEVIVVQTSVDSVEMTRKHAWLLAAAIFLLALTCRTAWAVAPRTVRWDEPDYLIFARNLLRGDGYLVFNVPDTIWPPGAPMLAAGAMALGIPDEAALAIWQVLAGALACVLLFGLARDVTGIPRVAALAGVLAAVSPALVVWPLYWGSATEAPFLALLLAGWWASWWVLRNGSWRAATAAGLAFGASYLVRTEGILWWALLLAALTFRSVRDRRAWRAVGALVITFGLIAAPYVLYLQDVTGRWMLSGKTAVNVWATPAVLAQRGTGQDVLSHLDSAGTEILWLSPDKFDVGLLAMIRADPSGFVARLRANFALTVDALHDPLFGPALLGLAVFGLFIRPWSRRRWDAMMFWLAMMAPLGVLYVSKVETRYLIPLISMVLVWSSRGIWQLAEWVQGTIVATWSRRVPAWPIAGLLVATLIIAGVWGQWTTHNIGQASQTPLHEAAGLWLAEHSAPDAAVMSRNSEIALYADRPLVAFPNATWEQVMAYGRARAARYLVTDDWEISRRRPQLSALLNPATAPSDLVHEVSFSDGRRTTLVHRVIDLD